MNKKWKNKNFKSAFMNSLSGIFYVFCNERNFKIQTCFAIIVIFLSTVLHISMTKFCILLLCIALVLFAELVNSSIEIALDLYSTEYNEKIKIAKDIASGAVTIISMFSAIIGTIILFPVIINYLKML